MADNLLGNIFQLGNIMRIENALVEEAVCFNNSDGYIIISYSEPSGRTNFLNRRIRLNINRNTRIINTLGRNMCTCCIREGMWVNAIFSSAMTRSIPPQANAFVIVVQGRRPEPVSFVTVDRITFVDRENGFIYTGNPNNVNRQTRFVITRNTTITNSQGRNVGINALRPGQMVRITHANFQTASIPPQTTAFSVQIL